MLPKGRWLHLQTHHALPYTSPALTPLHPCLPARLQAPRGGLRDKPGKPADYYHTCYCLSGLASSQHYSGVVLGGAQVGPRCGALLLQLLQVAIALLPVHSAASNNNN